MIMIYAQGKNTICIINIGQLLWGRIKMHREKGTGERFIKKLFFFVLLYILKI